MVGCKLAWGFSPPNTCDLWHYSLFFTLITDTWDILIRFPFSLCKKMYERWLWKHIPFPTCLQINLAMVIQVNGNWVVLEKSMLLSFPAFFVITQLMIWMDLSNIRSWLLAKQKYFFICIIIISVCIKLHVLEILKGTPWNKLAVLHAILSLSYVTALWLKALVEEILVFQM